MFLNSNPGYCANWAQLLEQGGEISRLENVEVRFQDEDIEHPTTEVAETATSTKCKQYVKCDASNEYNGQPCNKGYICEKWGNGPQCLHWVNCIHQCYCKSWANLLEQASEENEANVRFLHIASSENFRLRFLLEFLIGLVGPYIFSPACFYVHGYWRSKALMTPTFWMRSRHFRRLSTLFPLPERFGTSASLRIRPMR